MNGADSEPPFGEGAGFVKRHDPEISRAFKRFAIANQDPVPRREPGRDHDHEGYGQAQRVGAGDDQYRDRPRDRCGQIAGDGDPHDEGRRRDPNRPQGEPVGRPISQSLESAAGGLCFLDQPRDLPQRRRLARPGETDAEGAFTIDGTCDDLVARPLGNRSGFPREKRFVDARRAGVHHAISGNLFARPDEDAIAPAELAHGHILDVCARHTVRDEGDQGREVFKRAAGSLD